MIVVSPPPPQIDAKCQYSKLDMFVIISVNIIVNNKEINFTYGIATLEKICNGFWIPENIRFTVNVDARVLQKV